MTKKIFISIIFSLLLGSIFISQYFFDQNKSKNKTTEPIVLKSEIVKVADLGLNNAAADLAWLSGIQYFGGRSTANYAKMTDYLDLTTQLDSKFSYPYAFGVLILPSIKKTDEAIDLAKKGIEEATPDWRIPYYLATTYHINKKDNKNASYYFDVAANTAGAPDTVKRIAASYGTRSDIRSQTEQIWLGIYESSNDEVVKERAKKYITHYELLSFLEEAALKYKENFGSFPATANDMIPKILSQVPKDPFGFEYKFDETGRAVIK